MNAPAEILSQPERDALLMELKQIESWQEQAKLRREFIHKRLLAGLFPTKKVGTNRYELGRGYEVKAVVQQRIKINKNEENDFAHLRDMVDKLPPEVQSTILKWTPEISGTVYRSLPKEQQEIVNAVCTVSDYVSELGIDEPKQPQL